MKPLFVKWLTTVSGGLAGGWLVGACLEWQIGRLSFYEMSAPGELTQNGILLALPLSCLAGAVVTWNDRSPRWTSQVVRVSSVAMVSLAGGVLVACLAGAMVKLGVASPVSTHVSVPLARVWFCQGLLKGSLVFALIGFFWFLWREVAEMRSRSSASRGL